MDDPEPVSGVQPLGQLRPELGHLLGRERSVSAQKLPQVGAIDKVHDDREGLALDNQIVHADYMRVTDRRQQAAFLHEPLDDPGITGQITVQQLEGEDSVLTINAPPDFAARTSPDHAL
ncbi:MAG: hypothetical protein WCG47_26200 [Dermatophilaceae bacterium]